MARDGLQPLVSVLMANHNGGTFIEAAVKTVLGQTLVHIELLIVDDASTDDSISRLMPIAARDSRLRILRRSTSGGPGAARNLALDGANGRWLAVVDSDDLIHPERLADMVAEAETSGADILLDDLLIFAHAGDAAPATLFRGPFAREPQWVGLDAFIRSNRLYGAEAPLGFGKPLIRRQALMDAGVRYAEDLPVGEDYDLLARAMFQGLRMRTLPRLGYFYRKHDASISHRLDEGRLSAMAANAQQFRRDCARPDIEAAMVARERSIVMGLGFDRLVGALKARDVRGLIGIVRAEPRALLPLRTTVRDKLARAMRALRPRSQAREPAVVVISRQRVVGSTNGSSRYLLSVCRSIRQAGLPLAFVGPTPATFGRWPVMRLGPEMRIFQHVDIRGGLRVGDYVVARDPRVLGRALLTGVELVLGKLGLVRRGWVKPAPYAISAPMTREDQMFVARHGRGARAILCDYAFATPLAPFALSPGAPCAVLMHDLFSSRKSQFDAVGAADSVATLDEGRELALLSQADCILAVQKSEARVVAAGLPGRRVIVAPLAVEPVEDAACGDDDTVLFVGSNNAPNVLGLTWLFEQVWPLVTTVRPQARLMVAGNVSRAFDGAPPGATLLGVVPDLKPLYRDAAVVVSPLLTGSGLKIKVVEAIAEGKAMVVTSISLQGVEEELAGAVRLADDAPAFARHVLELLADRELRRRLGAVALVRAREHFSEQACYGELIQFITHQPGDRVAAPVLNRG